MLRFVRSERVYAERRIEERFAVNLRAEEFLLVAKLTFAASHEKIGFCLVYYKKLESSFLKGRPLLESWMFPEKRNMKIGFVNSEVQ